jgi:hypothetical protein
MDPRVGFSVLSGLHGPTSTFVLRAREPHDRTAPPVSGYFVHL